MLSLLLTLSALAGPVDVKIQRLDSSDPTVTMLLNVRDGEGVVTDWRTSDVSVTVDGDPAEIKRISRFAESGESFGTMLLFDTSCSMKAPVMPQVHKAANAYIDGMTGRDVASFAWFNDASYGEDNPWSDNKPRLKGLVQQLKAVGRRTHFYESLNKVIEAIAANPRSPRYRSVLVLSDGKDEGSPEPYSFERAVRLAREKSVPINAVGFVPPRGDPAGLSVLQALAHDTNGRYEQARTEDQIAQRFSEFQDGIHNLVLLEFDTAALSVGDHLITVTLDGEPGTGAVQTRLDLEVPWSGRAIALSPPEASDDGEEDSDEDGWSRDKKMVALAVALGGGGLLLLLVGLGAVLFFRRQSAEEESFSTPAPVAPVAPIAPVAPPTYTAPAAPLTTPMKPQAPARPAGTVFRPVGSAPLAQLQVEGAPTVLLFSTGAQSVVGSDPARASAVVGLDTISGAHATFTRAPDGTITIEDRGSTNGTYVNGSDIRQRGPIPLSHGQRLRLGTVNMTLLSMG